MRKRTAVRFGLAAALLFCLTGVARSQCTISVQNNDGFAETNEFTFDANAGTNGINNADTVSVTVTGQGCSSWNATPSVSWIQIQGPGTGSGNGSLNYTVSQNTGAPRTGSITFALGGTTATYTVNQTGPVLALPGPYRIDYEYNAAGCSSNNENPFSCQATSGSGPYVLSPSAGVYTITVNSYVPPGSQSATPFQALVWTGDNTTGSATVLPSTPNQTATVTVAPGQQLVLYSLSGTNSKKNSSNDPNGFADVSVALAASQLTISCTPTTGPTQVGVSYSATCTASGGTAPYTWSISAGSLPVGVSLSGTSGSSVNVAGTPTSAGSYGYTVQVTDSTPVAPQTAQQNYSGTVAAAPPPPLVVSCSPTTGPTQVGVSYSASCTASGGTSPYTWSISSGLPAGLSFNPSGSSATISGTPQAAAGYNYTVKVSDSSSPQQTQTAAYSGTIAPAALTVSCTPSTGPTQVGISYSATCTSGGGTAPFTWSIVAGTLPTGVTLTPVGAAATISGAPTTAGSYAYTVQIADSGSPQQVAKQSYSGTVAPSAPSTLTASCAPSTGPTRVGTSYSASCTSQGGTAPYKWTISSGSLPAGINLTPNGASAAIGGTPSAAGAYTYTVQVSDSSSPPQSVAQSYSGTIAGNTSALTVGCSPNAGPSGTGAPYNAVCTATGGSGTYKWAITSGSLPAGISLSATTGSAIVISGTPTSAGNYSYTVTVNDTTTPTPQKATQSFSGTILAAITLTGLQSTATPTQTVSVGVQLPGPAQSAIQGTLKLSFTPSVSGLPAGYMDPALQFSCSSATCSSGNTVLSFTIPAGQSSVSPLPGGTIQQGTVAGTITVTVTSLTSGGANILPQSGVSGSITVPELAPVITANSVQITNVTATGFNVQLTGYSTTRDVSTANLTFTAAAGTELLGTTTFSVPVATPFSQWFNSSTGQDNGSLFLLTIPFNLSGNITVVQSVTVTLTNSVGTSTPASGTQ